MRWPLHKATRRALGSFGLRVSTSLDEVRNRFDEVWLATALHPRSIGLPEGWLSEPSDPPHRHHAVTLDAHPTSNEETVAITTGVYRGVDVTSYLGSWTVCASDDEVLRGGFGAAFRADGKVVAVTADGQPYGDLHEGLLGVFDRSPKGAPGTLVLVTAIATSLGNTVELDRTRTASASTP